MKRRVWLGLAMWVVTLPLGGCSLAYVLAAERAVDERARSIEEKSPVFEVVAPEALATVRRVAVVDFRDISYRENGYTEVYPGTPMQGRLIWNHDAASLMLAEHFENQLLTSRAVEVVERSRLTMVLDEQALQASGITGEVLPEMAAGTAGADAVLLGTITAGLIYSPQDPGVRSLIAFSVSVRLVDTRDGRILAFGRDSVMRADHLPDVQEALETLSSRLVGKLAAAVNESRARHPAATAPAREQYMVPHLPAGPAVAVPRDPAP